MNFEKHFLVISNAYTDISNFSQTFSNSYGVIPSLMSNLFLNVFDTLSNS